MANLATKATASNLSTADRLATMIVKQPAPFLQKVLRQQRKSLIRAAVSYFSAFSQRRSHCIALSKRWSMLFLCMITGRVKLPSTSWRTDKTSADTRSALMPPRCKKPGWWNQAGPGFSGVVRLKINRSHGIAHADVVLA